MQPYTPAPARPVVTYVLIGACIAMFALTAALPRAPIGAAALWPLDSYFQPWQIVTYAFLHGDLTHLAFNMLGIYMFGGELENVFGRRRYALLYFASVITAAIAQLAVGAYEQSPHPTIGASGGLFGLLLAFAMVFPRRTIVPLIPPIPMPAWLFVTIYACIELYLGVTGTLSGIAHFAHLGGLVGAFALLMLWRGQAQRRIR